MPLSRNFDNRKNYGEIAEKILYIISNPQNRLRMINQGIQHVSENFKYEKRLNDFQKILTSFKCGS
jgi:glycosyltransferase involved in cell wall biosynthesis